MNRTTFLCMVGLAGLASIASLSPVTADDTDPPAAAPAPAYAPMTVDENVPDVKGEDSRTKLERLDGLLMQTHRQLSIARTQEQSKDVVEKLQKKIDTINEQRTATMRKLHLK